MTSRRTFLRMMAAAGLAIALPVRLLAKAKSDGEVCELRPAHVGRPIAGSGYYRGVVGHWDAEFGADFTDFTRAVIRFDRAEARGGQVPKGAIVMTWPTGEVYNGLPVYAADHQARAACSGRWRLR
jgi:hypothetical protein